MSKFKYIYKYFLPIVDDDGHIAIRTLYSPQYFTTDDLLSDPYTVVEFSWNEDCHDIDEKYDCQHKKDVFNHYPTLIEIYFNLTERFAEYAREWKERIDEHNGEGDYLFTRNQYRNDSKLYQIFRNKLFMLIKKEGNK